MILIIFCSLLIYCNREETILTLRWHLIINVSILQHMLSQSDKSIETYRREKPNIKNLIAEVD